MKAHIEPCARPVGLYRPLLQPLYSFRISKAPKPAVVDPRFEGYAVGLVQSRACKQVAFRRKTRGRRGGDCGSCSRRSGTFRIDSIATQRNRTVRSNRQQRIEEPNTKPHERSPHKRHSCMLYGIERQILCCPSARQQQIRV